MQNYHNKTRLIGKIGFLEIDNLEDGKKKIRFQLCTNTPFRDSKGKPQKELTWHQCIAWDKYANILEKHTTAGDIVAIDGVLVSMSDGTNTKDFPQAFVQVDELLLLDKV
jgi:single-stranded DNA-binding protein